MYEIEPVALRTPGDASVVAHSVAGGMWAWTALESAGAGESR